MSATHTLRVTDAQLEAIRGVLPDLAEKAQPIKKRAPRGAAIKWQSPGLPPLKRMTVSEMDRAEADWNRACVEARRDVTEGRESRAGLLLRELVARHRPTA